MIAGGRQAAAAFSTKGASNGTNARRHAARDMFLPTPVNHRTHASSMLTDAQRKHLRRLGHDRNPIVLIGNNGLGPNLIAEMDRALTDHELVKVRARVGDRNLRDDLLAELATATRSELVQRIGHVALYYRPDPEQPRILLPDGSD
jgi:RNA-binding protein